MKFTCALLLVAVASAAAATTVRSDNGITVTFTEQPEAPELQLCTTCSSLTGQALNILLNEVLNAGVVGGCSKLCSGLKSKGSSTVCNLACDLVGIKAFAAALEKADLDPLYFCGILGVCKADDNGAGSCDTVTVDPPSAPQATAFNGQMSVTVTNHTGYGEFRFGIEGGVDQPSGASSVYPELAPGSYGVKISIDTTPSQDPTQGAQWIPGTYTLSGEFCMGECGSKHPHSKSFGTASTNFTITPAAPSPAIEVSWIADAPFSGFHDVADDRKCHYDDPFQAHGCQADEKNVTVTGVPGSFCAPKCSATATCPTDVCDGTVAKPQCALQDTSGNKYCALVCNPKQKSGFPCSSDEHMNCEPIQGTGLCTYYS